MPSMFVSVDMVNDMLAYIENDLGCPYRLDFQNNKDGGWGLIISVDMDYSEYLEFVEDMGYDRFIDGDCLDLFTPDDVYKAYGE